MKQITIYDLLPLLRPSPILLDDDENPIFWVRLKPGLTATGKIV